MQVSGFGMTLTPEILKLIDFSDLGQDGANNLLTLYRGDLGRMLVFDNFLQLYGNPKLNEIAADFYEMIPVRTNPMEAVKYQNLLARFVFQEGQANAITGLTSKYTLFAAHSLFDKIIVGGNNNLTRSNYYFKDVEVMANSVTSEER